MRTTIAKPAASYQLTRIGRRERGIALVLVLWAITLLTVIASSFAFVSRTETLLSRNHVSMARARILADAGIERGLYELYKPEVNPGRWKLDGRPYVWDFDGAKIRIFVRDTHARIDLNTADKALLKGLLTSIGLKEEEAIKVYNAIADWQDADDFKRENGAEANDYISAGRSYTPANAPFETVQDLRLVLGVTPELFDKLEPLLTIYSRQKGFNSVSASPEVIYAIPAVNREGVVNYLAEREKARAENRTINPYFEAQYYQPERIFPRHEIVAQATLPDGTTFTREAVVWLAPPMPRPVNFYSWREGRAIEKKAADEKEDKAEEKRAAEDADSEPETAD